LRGGEHDRHLDQHTDNGRKRRTRLKPEQSDRRGDGQLKEVAQNGRWKDRMSQSDLDAVSYARKLVTG